MTGTFLLRRLVLAVPTLIGVATVVFVLLRVVPGDPIAMMLPSGATEADIASLRHLYGLDRSIPVQFGVWAWSLLRGDLGVSITLRQGVLGLILTRLPATLELSGLALLLGLAGAAKLAFIGVYWTGRWPEAVVDTIGGIGQAIPDFLWGLLFILTLGVLVPVMPISGRIDPEIETKFVTQFFLIESLITGQFQLLGDLLWHIALPAIALSLPLMAIISRVFKASLHEAMRQDYVLLARIRGFSRARIILREAARNAIIPAVTLVGVQFNFLLGGTVLIERIFSYPGIGNMAIGAVLDRDLPLIQGLILTFAVLFIITNFIVDGSYVLLNPRLRHG
jgi:ABC-type dipeptide/oligopeptide/nickel transport system permease component